jgi:hypothetical protein
LVFAGQGEVTVFRVAHTSSVVAKNNQEMSEKAKKNTGLFVFGRSTILKCILFSVMFSGHS